MLCCVVRVLAGLEWWGEARPQWGGGRARGDGSEGRGRLVWPLFADKSFRESLGSGWAGGRERKTHTPTPTSDPHKYLHTEQKRLGHKSLTDRQTPRGVCVCVSSVGSRGELEPTWQSRRLRSGPAPIIPALSFLWTWSAIARPLTPPPIKLPETFSSCQREEGGE